MQISLFVIDRVESHPRVRLDLKKQAHLLIDGYNVILGLPELKEIFGHDKERARDELARIARAIHDGDGVRVTLVFDGAGVDHEIVRPGKELTFSYLFASASTTADGVIEGLLANETEPSTVTVVTKDRAILHATLEAGAGVMNPEDMVKWADQSASEERDRAARTRPSGAEGFGTDLNALL